MSKIKQTAIDVYETDGKYDLDHTMVADPDGEFLGSGTKSDDSQGSIFVDEPPEDELVQIEAKSPNHNPSSEELLSDLSTEEKGSVAIYFGKYTGKKTSSSLSTKTALRGNQAEYSVSGIEKLVQVKEKYQLELAIVEGEAMITAGLNGIGPEGLKDFLKNNEMFKESLEKASSKYLKKLEQFSYFNFGRRGFFSPIELSEITPNGTFIYYNRVGICYPGGSLTPNQISDRVIPKNVHRGYPGLLQKVEKQTCLIRGHGKNPKAEISAGLAMVGHYKHQELKNSHYVGIRLFEETDAMRIASSVVKYVGKKSGVGYKELIENTLESWKDVIDNYVHVDWIIKSRNAAKLLVEHLFARLIDAEVLSATLVPMQNNGNLLYFSLHNKYSQNKR